MTGRTAYPPMLLLAALALAGCRDQAPPLPVEARADSDSAGGGAAPTADEIDAGVDLIEDALGSAPSP